MKYLDNFTSFDPITNFRMINRFLVTLGLSILLPVIMDLKGELLAPYVISMLLIAETLAVKTHKRLVRLKLSTLYKLGTGVHIVLLAVITLYFYSPLTFIVLVSIFAIIEIAIFGAFSIELDVYQSKHHHEDVQRFKVVRNSVVADVTLLGLMISTGLTLLNPTYAVIASLAVHTIFSWYFLRNWNYIERNSLDERLS